MKKRMPFPYWLAILAGFVLAGLFILKGFLYYAYWGEYNPERIRHMVAVHLANNVLWGVLTPIVYYFVSKYRVYPPAQWSERSKAIAASIFMAFFHETLSNIIIVIPFHLLGIEKISWENTKIILGLYPSAIIARLIEYWIIYAVFTAIDYQRKFRTKELELAQLENQLSVAQLNALRLQLQPHFLFNTLNTISSLMEFNVKGAQKIVSKLGGLLRKVLDGDKENLVELRDEIEFVRSYLDIEQVRFNDRLRVEYHIDERTLNALVPNLILQPLMENAIKHGFAQKTGDGLIVVFTTLKDGKLCLKIADDGHGSDQDQETLLANGIGLKNVVERLELLYPRQYVFQIDSNENKGFAVILEMPFQTKKGQFNMKKIRTLVVDDEPLARARIVHLLQRFDYIQLIGECKNGKEALDKIKTYQPDLVFLDVQMPDFNGFDVLTKAGTTNLPFIIFVTAYDQYALKAFGVHAVDYLLKPYDDDRFTQALEHAQKQIYLKENALLHQKMVQLLEDHKAKTAPGLTHFEIKDKGKTQLLKVADTCYFESHGNYVKIHQTEKSYLYRQTLAALKEQLNQDQFLQVHRSILINRHFIKSVKYTGNNQYLIQLKNEVELTSSRGYRDEIHAYMEDEDLRNA